MSWLDEVAQREYERMSRQQTEHRPQAAPTIPTNLESDRAHLYSWLVAVGIPLVQATVTGVAAGFSGTVLAWLSGDAEPWKWGVTSFVIVTGFTWLAGLRRWRELTRPLDVLGWAERLLQMDLNQDGAIDGEVIDPPQVVRIELACPNDGVGTSTRFIDLPIDDDRLRRLAAGLVAGQPFSEAEWSGGGKLLSRNEFRQVRQLFLNSGLVEWVSDKDRRQGAAVTPEGYTVFSNVAAGALPHLTERTP